MIKLWKKHVTLRVINDLKKIEIYDAACQSEGNCHMCLKAGSLRIIYMKHVWTQVLSSKPWNIFVEGWGRYSFGFFSVKNTSPSKSGDTQIPNKQKKWTYVNLTSLVKKPIRTFKQCNTSAKHILAKQNQNPINLYKIQSGYQYLNSLTHLEGAESPGFALAAKGTRESWLKLEVQIT